MLLQNVLQNVLLVICAGALPVLSASEESKVVGQTTHLEDVNSQKCGTRGPSNALRQAHEELRTSPGVHARAAASGPLVIETYVHWVTTFDQARFYSPTVRTNVISNQIAALNQAYRPAGISFQLSASSYTIRDEWATDAASANMKAALRRGSYSALNLYFQSNLSSNANTAGATILLGYCTLPSTVTYGSPPTEYPPSNYANDGCDILTGSMPSVPNPVYGYNEGKTAVHEVGHWFGLLHPFQDNTCTAGDPGDYVNDTPQESTATVGCPAGKDSCPSDPGLDPIHNYMDYSTDECYTEFTPNQITRMTTMYNMYRKGL